MSTTSPAGIFSSSIVFPLLSATAVYLRFYSRMRNKARLKFDDWVQIPALVCKHNLQVKSVSLLTQHLTATLFGNGRHWSHWHVSLLGFWDDLTVTDEPKGVANEAFGYPSPQRPITYTAPSTILCEKIRFHRYDIPTQECSPSEATESLTNTVRSFSTPFKLFSLLISLSSK